MTDESNVVPLAAPTVTAPTKEKPKERRIEPVSDRRAFEAKLADTFRDLEPIVFDLERAAKIAEQLCLDGEEDLGVFAVRQSRTMASDLVRFWKKRWKAAKSE